MRVADDTFWRKSECEWVKTAGLFWIYLLDKCMFWKQCKKNVTKIQLDFSTSKPRNIGMNWSTNQQCWWLYISKQSHSYFCILYPLMLAVAKNRLTILIKSLNQKHRKKIKGEILIRTPPTILFDIFCKISFSQKYNFSKRSFLEEFWGVNGLKQLWSCLMHCRFYTYSCIQDFAHIPYPLKTVLNPSDAEVIFVQCTKMQKIMKIIMWVFIRKLSLNTIRWVPMCQGFSHFPAFCQYLIMTNLATSNIRLKWH